jgi:hypothetical protein
VNQMKSLQIMIIIKYQVITNKVLMIYSLIFLNPLMPTASPLTIGWNR